jgi:hypothetical protein
MKWDSSQIKNKALLGEQVFLFDRFLRPSENTGCLTAIQVFLALDLLLALWLLRLSFYLSG